MQSADSGVSWRTLVNSCPDVDQILDASNAKTETADLTAHVAECESCRTELMMLRRVSSAFHESAPVPEDVILRTKASIRTC